MTHRVLSCLKEAKRQGWHEKASKDCHLGHYLETCRRCRLEAQIMLERQGWHSKDECEMWSKNLKYSLLLQGWTSPKERLRMKHKLIRIIHRGNMKFTKNNADIIAREVFDNKP